MEHEHTTRSATKGRWQLLGLALVFFGPLLAAYFLYFSDSLDRDSVNYGELLSPPVSLDAKLHFDTGLRGRWTLWVMPGQRCDKACTDALVTISQVRLATGREIDRIERALLVSGDDALVANSDAHPGLHVFARNGHLGNAVATALDPLTMGHIYIMDPLGNVMMRYPFAPERKPMLGDLKKLLKFSRIG
ncbi:MAG: hypothetical protein AAF004_01270 [Pseudomonadota bacterium]